MLPVRNPFSFLVLLRISFCSDVDCNLTLLSNGWPHGKEKILPFHFCYSLLSTQSPPPFFTSKHASKGKRKRRKNYHCSSSLSLVSLLLSTPHVPNLVCHPSGLNQLVALYLLKSPRHFHGNVCFKITVSQNEVLEHNPFINWIMTPILCSVGEGGWNSSIPTKQLQPPT